MRISLTAAFLLALGLIHPANALISGPDDLDGSGDDMDSSGSGSGDWSEEAVSPGEITNLNARSNDLNLNDTHWSTKDIGSGYIIVARNKSFFENKQVIAGITAGGITGLILALMLTALLIYKWHNKDLGYSTGHKTQREVIV